MTSLAKHKNLQKIVGMIEKKSPLQKKRLNKYFSKNEDLFFVEADILAETIVRFLESQNIPLEQAVDFYLELCAEIMRCQRKFSVTGEYPIKSSSEIFKSLYNDETQMKPYIMGLGFSQFLWETHYLIFRFFKNSLENSKDNISSYMEIGPGHGLFLVEAIRTLNSDCKFHAIDISPISTNFTKSIIEFAQPQAANVLFNTSDFLGLDTCSKYDFIAMGEVIEHTDEPSKMLTKLKDLLNPKGRAFISTCVNCPAPDHIYHFKAVSEIKEMVEKCGLTIEKDLVLPVEDLPMEKIVKNKTTINYCSILRKIP
jgi:2-polyprenyl-3-methyl-5-hydroxy-6-metoxy-1,4-benzoquinol methylase